MGFHFNGFLLSEHYLSVLYADCMLLAQASWALESGERGQFSLVAVVHSSTAPWHGRMSFLSKRKLSIAGSYRNGHLALSGHSHNCWAAVQFSLAFPPGKLERGWEEVEVPSDPSILNQLGASLPWDRPVCWSMRGLKMGKKRLSLPWGLWTLFFAHLTEWGARKQHHMDARLQNCCPAASLDKGSMILKHSPDLHCSCLREQQHGWKTFMSSSARTSSVCIKCYISKRRVVVDRSNWTPEFATRRLQEKLSRHTQLLRKEVFCDEFRKAKGQFNWQNIKWGSRRRQSRGGAFCGYELKAKWRAVKPCELNPIREGLLKLEPGKIIEFYK